jgi:hypothetical protein
MGVGAVRDCAGRTDSLASNVGDGNLGRNSGRLEETTAKKNSGVEGALLALQGVIDGENGVGNGVGSFNLALGRAS